MTDQNQNHEHEEEMQQEAPQDEQRTEAENAFKEFVHHQRIALEELGRAIESLIPKDFRDHTRNAGKAFVDSFKVFVDTAREDMQRSSEAKQDEPSATKVKVEIE